MGALALVDRPDQHLEEMISYLSTEDQYWLDNDKWNADSKAYKSLNLSKIKDGRHTIADFETYGNESVKIEAKYAILLMMKESIVSAYDLSNLYSTAIKLIGDTVGSDAGISTLAFKNAEDTSELNTIVPEVKPLLKNKYAFIKRHIIKLVTELYSDKKEEIQKDVWYARKIPGIKQSATAKRHKTRLSFEEIPECYRESVKRYFKRLIYKRSWSFCHEMLIYIRTYYRLFYEHGYTDGFQENLTRKDVEEYISWIAEEHADDNATYRSKAVSFIRNWLEFIQLAEYSQAPVKDMTHLIFDDDIPKRERPADTYEKIKYIPEPVRNAIDAAIDDIEPAEMKPVYVLLRETGWRGTDILNLRYDNCLDYVWNSKEEIYVPYLYGEITKTGIPILKIPVREEVASLLKTLIDEAKGKSTDENNPDRYLFNTYEGKNKGLPYSKPAFTSAVQDLINRKNILDGNGEVYHFRTHSLRHTRAMEYTEQGMPIGIIQQILGHCSLQMTLHYSKVSEDMLYKKWNETEKLNLFKPDVAPPDPDYQNTEDIHFERIRKNLDAVKVPFGICFKPAKIACKQQMNMCIECPSFCTTKEDLPEYEAEIKRVRDQIRIGEACGREDWVNKNTEYLKNLEKMRERILSEGTIHKNGKLREE